MSNSGRLFTQPIRLAVAVRDIGTMEWLGQRGIFVCERMTVKEINAINFAFRKKSLKHVTCLNTLTSRNLIYRHSVVS